MRMCIPYGNGAVSGEMNWARPLGTLDVTDTPGLSDVEAAVGRAIECPIGLDKSIYQMVSPGETVVVLVSDMFRETGVHQVLPILVEGLNRAGIRDEAIAILFATGTHRAPTPEEQAHILGLGVCRRFQSRTYVHDPHDAENLVYIGMTSRGTPVEINKRAHDADRLIATGAVVLHYFGGYGGGRKSIVPGIASADTIAHNHAMNLDPHEDRPNPAVRIGVLDGNPVAEDMLEGARLAQVDYIVNTVLNRNGQIAAVFAGELDAAHRAAAAYARGLYAVQVTEQADLVVASSGAAKNFVQAHKALYNAYQAVKPAGRIVFLAKCEEGLGGEQFEKWVQLGNREAIIKGLREQAEINGQTALSALGKAPITIFVTEMPRQQVEMLGARKADSLDEALALARQDLPDSGVSAPTCYFMPSASYAVPLLNRKRSAISHQPKDEG